MGETLKSGTYAIRKKSNVCHSSNIVFMSKSWREKKILTPTIKHRKHRSTYR